MGFPELSNCGSPPAEPGVYPDYIMVITHLRELTHAFETHIEVKKDPARGSFYQILSFKKGR